jgi:hypothetical protein
MNCMVPRHYPGIKRSNESIGKDEGKIPSSHVMRLQKSGGLWDNASCGRYFENTWFLYGVNIIKFFSLIDLASCRHQLGFSDDGESPSYFHRSTKTQVSIVGELHDQF